MEAHAAPLTMAMGLTGTPRPTAIAPAGTPRQDGRSTGRGQPLAATAGSAPRAEPVPMRPRGGFGAYLHDLRRLRGMTIRTLGTVAGLHHTYVSKLERGDRQAPDPRVVEALATALAATPSQVDQLRWRAGLGVGAPNHRADGPETAGNLETAGSPETVPGPVETGDPGVSWPGGLAPIGVPTDADATSVAPYAGGRAPLPEIGDAAGPVDPLSDPALTLVADALSRAGGDGREALRRSVAAAVAAVQALPVGHPGLGGAPAPVRWPSPATRRAAREVPALPIPHAPSPSGIHVVNVERFAGGVLTLEAAAAEVLVAPDYLWQLVQAGHLAAWVLPGTPVGSVVGVRVRREDVLGLLHPLAFAPPRA